MSQATRIADLEIKITNEAKGATTSLNNLAKSLKEFDKQKNALDFGRIAGEGSQGLRQLEVVATRLTKILTPLATQMDKIAKGFSSLRTMSQTFGTTKTEKGVKKLTKKLEESTGVSPAEMGGGEATATAMSEVATASESATKGTTDFSSAVEENRSKVSLLVEKLDLLKQKYAELSADPSKQMQANATALQIKGVEQQIAKSMTFAKPKGTDSIKQTANEFREANTEASKLTQTVSKLGTHVKVSATAVGRLASQFVRLAKLKAMRMIVQQFYQSIGQGITNLYEYSRALGSLDSANFKNTMDGYATSLQTMRNTIASALAPALQSLLPIIQTVINYFATAVNVINQFFSALQGKTVFTKAVDSAVEFGGALSDASGSAKELNRTILGFDELNVLNDNDKGGGGGGASATPDYELMFKETAISNGILNFVEELKPKFESMWRVIGQIKELVIDIWNSDLVQGLVKSVIRTSIEAIGSALDIVKDVLAVISSLLSGNYKELFINLGILVVDIITGVVRSIWGIVDVVSNVVKFVVSLVGDAIVGILGLLEKVPFIGEKWNVAGVKENVKSAVDVVNTFIDEGVGGVYNAMDRFEAVAKLDFATIKDSGLDAFRGISDEVQKLSTEDMTYLQGAYDDAKWHIENNKVVYNGDDAKLQRILNKMKISYIDAKTGIEHNPTELQLDNKNAVNQIKELEYHWINDPFGAKSLNVDTSRIYNAVDAFKNYWQTVDLNRKAQITIGLASTAGEHIPYSGGRLTFASGGFPDYGSVFIAGESGAGAEMVGNINGRTGVASQGEITGIRQSVEATGRTEAQLLAEQNSLLRQLLAKDSTVTLSTASIVDGLNRANRRAGKSVVTMG